MFSKNVLYSIIPKYCALIINGQKTSEIRKTKPKIKPPFKGYIYCTKQCELWIPYENGQSLCRGDGRIIGEFICDNINEYEAEFTDEQLKCYEDIRLILTDEDGEEYFKLIASNEDDNPNDNNLCRSSCLTFEEIKKYVGVGIKRFYAYHISDLVIYDEPKQLSDFFSRCTALGNIDDKKCISCPYFCFDTDSINGYVRWCSVYKKKPLTKAPQSWCYVEERITK